jgi:hypothetical protein
VSAPKQPSAPTASASFWKRIEIRVALIAGLFGLIAAAINFAGMVLKKSDPPANPPTSTAGSAPQSSVTSVAPVTVNNSSPVTVNNNISTGPDLNSSLAEKKKPVLEQFVLNSAESFFQLCSEGRRCSYDNWPVGVPHWVPSEQYWRFSGADYIRSPADDKRYNENPSFYDRHFQPVFDVVISNPLSRPIVLTAFDVIVLRQIDYAAGDGEAPADSGVIKVMNRYVVPVGKYGTDIFADSTKNPFPVIETYAATPPIEIPPNRPGRFQVSLDNQFGNLEIYELRLRFRFGSSGTIQTDRFRLTF